MAQTAFMYTVSTHSASESRDLAARLAAQLQPGDIVALEGDLASGKTTFTQGLTQFFKIDEYAASPTFTYMNEYHAGGVTILHIDAYRLNSGSELIGMGFWEYVENDAIAIIEWADIVADILPAEVIRLQFQRDDQVQNQRHITITSPRKLDLK
ncbi:MAG: tRNA (adenosine(37)-N6)-threonylcarbamoyltransferase complex ATPase subunit type 1 TsaE [Candidatus Marinimicrobia bacterium]|nr:tRNA (adenosine(37)-N6)-threonylcarbamoyltransferase complex ATPase subunit type 1 TsaE [Candidatus Neomarinimicrobiota bacterium]MCF7840497.1 tRNA (adenosine(37)-N6)-threonylcarbamoyltransferase complex ATPase subunit type 1 TsaE [Candidatus Neomarinimicrobiota bacterium]